MATFKKMNASVSQKRFPEKTGWKEQLFSPVSNTNLVLFRIMFGFLLACHCFSQILNGTVKSIFIEPPFTFNFIGFDFLQPIQGNGMYYYFTLMGILALMIMTGTWYKISMLLFALMWTAVYLMQKSNYNNHYYLMVLLSWIMLFLPAHQRLSVDSIRNKSNRKTSCPRWVYGLMIAQLFIVYTYAGLGKLNMDWLSGRFISIRFSKLAMHNMLGIIYGNSVFQTLVTYSGLLFDLLIVPLMCFKKTRRCALIAAVIFHLFNSYTFRIGIFPYLSIAMLIFFFKPIRLRWISETELLYDRGNKVSPKLERFIMYALLLYLVIQIWLPLRSHLFQGNVFWTEEGYRMSWRMMLRTKSGSVLFRVKDAASGKQWQIDPAMHFKPVHLMWLSGSPDIIWQYAQRIKKAYKRKGYPDVEVYAIGKVSMNRYQAQSLIDPNCNLAAVKWEPFRNSNWILPFNAKKKE
jgi:hypothetical protein